MHWAIAVAVVVGLGIVVAFVQPACMSETSIATFVTYMATFASGAVIALIRN